MYHASNGLYFSREANGDVTITSVDEETSETIFKRTVDRGHWASAVLSMSTHGERPGDWSDWMDHHEGRKDLFEKMGR